MADMFTVSLISARGLVARYDFTAENVKDGTPGTDGIARASHPVSSISLAVVMCCDLV